MVKKLLFVFALMGAFVSCDQSMSELELEDALLSKTSKNDKEKNDKKPKKTKTYKLDVKAQESSNGKTRAFDGNLNWYWENGDALKGYQIAYDNIRNRLAYDPSTGLFSCADFTYQSSSPERFHFIYPSAAEIEKGTLKALQDGTWRPVAVFTTEAVKIDALPTLRFEQLTSALELRIWNMDNTMMQEKVVSAVLTSDTDFVGEWVLDESTMTYTQTLNGKDMVIEGLNTPIVQINMPHLPEGYPAGTNIKLVLTREDGKTMTTYLPSELTFVKQKRTVFNMIFVPDPTFTCATYNVDGLSSIIGGTTSNKTKQISEKLAVSSWDIIAFQEDFNHHDNLISSIKNKYQFGENRDNLDYVYAFFGGVCDTDGLGFATLTATSTWSNETFVEFTDKYGGITNGANTCIKKGFRYYTVTMKDGLEIDVYVTHMNSGSSDGHINARASQFRQLATYINEHRSGRPIVIMGDFNARYTRDDYQANFWGVLNPDLYANMKDAWTELVWDGYYPEYGTPSWVVSDKYDPNNTVGDIKYGEQDGEVVDKIIYINDPDSDVRIWAKSYKRDMDYSDLADHTPVVVEFGYEKK